MPDSSLRETVRCGFCGAEPGVACDFPEDTPTVDEDGVTRRPVHAARFAQTLPADERSAFWSRAVDDYLVREVAAGGSDPQ